MKISVYKDKVTACWLGKNIGGTLGGPFEGKRGTFDLDYYTHDLSKGVLPNDDLDLQLIWLLAAEEYGRGVNSEILGEYWLTFIPCDWSEYGAGKNNLRFGLLPPVSGAYKNPYAESNGAWIRSEIWACLNPGNPAQAVRFAFEDATVDHSGDGVYSELFCAAVESAAFAENDIKTLIDIGLSYIPDKCLLRDCINLVKACRASGKDWRDTRKKLLQFAPSPFGLRYVYDNNLPDKNPEPDIPMGEVGRDAATNVAIAVIGLLWGEGDFTKSLCIAASCGEDTDCTAGFIGSLMGIMRGTRGIEARWTDPIGDEIKTCTLDKTKGGICGTVTELTNRIVRLMPAFVPGQCAYPTGEEPELSYPETSSFFLPVKTGLFEYTDKRDALSVSQLFVRKNGILFDASLSFDDVTVTPCVSKELTLTVYNKLPQQQWISLHWCLPEGWSIAGGPDGCLLADQYTGKTSVSRMKIVITPPDNVNGKTELLLRLTVNGHPSSIFIPIVFIA